MAKLGSEKKPICVSVQDDEGAAYVDSICSKNGWHYIMRLAPDEEEDFVELEKALNPELHQATATLPQPEKIGRNDSCPCGSGKKFKNCCG